MENEVKEEPQLIVTCIASDKLRETISCKQDEKDCKSKSCPYMRIQRAELI